MIHRALVKVLSCAAGGAVVLGMVVYMVIWYNRAGAEISVVTAHPGEIVFTDAEKQMIREAIEHRRLERSDLLRVRQRLTELIDHPRRVELALANLQPGLDGSNDEGVVVGFAILGAIFGLMGGIGWAIEHKKARWRFVGWTVAGWVVSGVVVGAESGNRRMTFIGG